MGSTRVATIKLDILDWEMEYNTSGIRTKRVSEDKTYSYIYAGDKLMRMTVGNDTLDFSYDTNGVPLTMTYNGTVYYYITNLQGDVISLELADGGSGAQYAYDAWGNIIAMSGTLAELNPLRYRGYVYDQETGFYYVSNRYYDPEIGRWINSDDTTNLGAEGAMLSYNLFAYCLNNPVNRFDVDGNWSLSNRAKIAIGVAAIAVGVIATALTGGAATPVLVASLKIAATSATIGAIKGAGISAVSHRLSTGSWKGAGTAAISGAIDGASDGFMWGGIAAGAAFTTVAAKGIRVQEIGKLKPSNKSGDGYLGVKYDAPKANGKYTTKSIELHSPHSNGPHNVWHWQQNTWSNYNGVSRITGSAKHWTIWGRRI